MHGPWHRFALRPLACLLALVLSCADEPIQIQPRYELPPLGRVGILPVEIPASISIHPPGFVEGFEAWSLLDNPPESSNSAADIVLLAFFLLSILTGIVGGVAVEARRPSGPEIAECTRNLGDLCQRIDLAKVTRDAIAEAIEGASPIGYGSSRDSIVAVYLDELDEGSEFDRSRVDAVLSVQITRLEVTAPNEIDERGPIVLTALAKLSTTDSVESEARTFNSDIGRGEKLNWRALGSGDTDRFNQSAERIIRLAVKSLASALVRSFAVSPVGDWRLRVVEEDLVARSGGMPSNGTDR